MTQTTNDALGRTLSTVEDYGGANKATLYAYGPAGMTGLKEVSPGQTTAWASGLMRAR